MPEFQSSRWIGLLGSWNQCHREREREREGIDLIFSVVTWRSISTQSHDGKIATLHSTHGTGCVYELAQDLIWQVRHREKGTCCYGLNVHERRADLCTRHMNVKCHIQSCKWYMKFHFLIANLREVELWWQLVFHYRDPISNMFGSPQHNVVNKHHRHNSYKAGWHYNICSTVYTTLHSGDLQVHKYLQMENCMFFKGKETRSSDRKLLQSTS